jgi:hypothetical protein
MHLGPSAKGLVMIEADAWNSLNSAISRLPLDDGPLVRELRLAALEYAQARGRWLLAPIGERLEQEASRSRSHDRFIDACNALSRACGRSALSQEWRSVWGDARSGESRRRIGDFACYIAYRLTVEAR